MFDAVREAAVAATTASRLDWACGCPTHRDDVGDEVRALLRPAYEHNG